MPADRMARPDYTARRREALLVYRTADGMLEIGKGRIRIAPGTVPYFRRVVADLGRILDMPGGAEAFEHGDALGRAVTIMQPKDPTLPANGWTLPDDVAAASGAGCASRIVYDPDNWPRHGDPASPASQDVLLKLLVQANICAAGTYIPPAVPEFPVIQGQLRLSCRPAKAGSTLSFAYVIENPGPGEVFVMDAMTCIDPATQAACARERIAMLIGDNGDATLGNYVPPEPIDRQIAVPVIPLARRLPVGGVLERRLEFPAPYVETSPWLPDLALEQHTASDIGAVVLAVGYWPAGAAGLVATEAAYAPGFYAITAPCGGALVSLRFPTTGLQFSRRAEASPT
jgi:hypothetical protein